MVRLNGVQLSSGDVATVFGYLNIKQDLETEAKSMDKQEEGETTQSRWTQSAYGKNGCLDCYVWSSSGSRADQLLMHFCPWSIMGQSMVLSDILLISCKLC